MSWPCFRRFRGRHLCSRLPACRVLAPFASRTARNRQCARDHLGKTPADGRQHPGGLLDPRFQKPEGNLRNQAYEIITGRTCESLLKDPTSSKELIHPDDRTHILGKVDEATRSGYLDQKFRIIGPG